MLVTPERDEVERHQGAAKAVKAQTVWEESYPQECTGFQKIWPPATLRVVYCGVMANTTIVEITPQEIHLWESHSRSSVRAPGSGAS